MIYGFKFGIELGVSGCCFGFIMIGLLGYELFLESLKEVFVVVCCFLGWRGGDVLIFFFGVVLLGGFVICLV